MGAPWLARYALSVTIVAVLLSACSGGSSRLTPAPEALNNGVLPLAKSETFHFSGSEQTFHVPDGVISVTLVVRGAQGGGAKGGRGGRVYAVIPVFSKEKLHVFVGGRGINEHGGFNGGGDGGDLSQGFAFGGGGASDIRIGGDELSNRIVVAGGGGGEGQGPDAMGAQDLLYPAAHGGKGGGGTGGKGQTGWRTYSYYGGGGGGGSGGSQRRGGDGGYGGEGSRGEAMPGTSGSLGVGGVGGAGCRFSSCNYGEDGAGGGGGYYGGGGGGAGGANSRYAYGGGGGGGGSSYIESKAKKFQSWQGWKNAIGDGLVVISWH